MKLVRLFLLFIIALPIFGLWEAKRAAACSGYTTDLSKYVVENAEHIVRAQAFDIDASGLNGIVRVESYLSGTAGAEYLLIHQADIPYFRGRDEGFFDVPGDCPNGWHNLQSAQDIYLFLDRRENGSYAIRTSYTFSSPDQTVQLFVANAEHPEQPQILHVTEAEFLHTVANLRGLSVEPLRTSVYPLKAPLEIVTSQNTTYLLPIDGSPPFEMNQAYLDEMLYSSYTSSRRYFSDAGNCSTRDCKHVSPDGLWLAVQNGPNTITLNDRTQFQGQALVFAPTSDAIAIWNSSTLQVVQLLTARDSFTANELPVPRREIELSGSIETLRLLEGQGAWTPDGRQLAYSDDRGLWLWDALTIDAEPQLIYPASLAIPIAQSFSPLGRYLAIIEGDIAFNLDVVSGTILPDGLVSPDERLLLTLNTQTEEPSAEVCGLILTGCNPVRPPHLFDFQPIEGTYELSVFHIDLPHIVQIEWMNTTQYLLYACNEDYSRCGVAQNEQRYFYGINPEATEAIAYDYDHENNTLAILADPSTIFIDRQPYALIDRQRYELSEYLDTDIVSIRWGESLFYHE